MTWELLLVIFVIAAVAGAIWAYSRRTKSPYPKHPVEHTRTQNPGGDGS